MATSDEKFAMIPLDALRDRRLTLELLRVLGALHSFRKSRGDCEVFPSRDAIADRCGIHPANISTATTALERLGWLSKVGKGGHSKASRYILNPSCTVADSATVNGSPTGNGSRIGNGSRVGYTLPLAESATRIEEKRPSNKSSPVGKKQGVTLTTFIATCNADGVKAIPDGDPIFEYAGKVGIDHEMLAAAWSEFKAVYLPTSKTQRDWRAHFRNAVRRNWFKLWFLKDGEPAGWTTAGEQARRAAA